MGTAAPAVPARTFEVELPIGVGTGPGPRRRDAALRRMRGYEEALLADPGLDGVRLATALLAACTVRLAGREPPRPAELAGLHVADRDYLLLELRRISYGDELAAAYRCPRCQAETVRTEDLASLPVRRLDPAAALPEPAVELTDGYQDRHGAVHTAVVLRLPRGSDEEFAALALGNGHGAAQDALLLRCITAFGGLTRGDLEAYGGRVLQELTVGDRAALARALRDGTPGVGWQREVRCGQCGLSSPHTLDVARFFPAG